MLKNTIPLLRKLGKEKGLSNFLPADSEAKADGENSEEDEEELRRKRQRLGKESKFDEHVYCGSPVEIERAGEGN